MNCKHGVWNTDYHMQRFDKDDGYFAIHCEQELHTCKRVLAWMYYLEVQSVVQSSIIKTEQSEQDKEDC